MGFMFLELSEIWSLLKAGW